MMGVSCIGMESPRLISTVNRNGLFGETHLQ